MLSEMVLGMTLDEAYTITAKDILNALGGLPDNKSPLLGAGGQGPADRHRRLLRQERVMDDRITTQNAKIVCECMQVTDEDIEHAVLEGRAASMNSRK